MGFLSGAYGKLMAGQHVRNLQHRMTQVQSRLRRVTREVGQAEKQLQSMQKGVRAELSSQMLKMGGVPSTFDQNNVSIDMSDASSRQYQMQQAQGLYTQASAYWDSYFDMMRESMLQPLKDEEDYLQTEKDNLESQIKIAQAEYDAKKEEEKEGAKNLAPNYTGQ